MEKLDSKLGLFNAPKNTKPSFYVEVVNSPTPVVNNLFIVSKTFHQPVFIGWYIRILDGYIQYF